MANDCFFMMKVTGTEQGIKRLWNALDATYHCEPDDPEHFWRIFDITNCNKKAQVKDHIYTEEWIGDCAWSTHSCMLDGSFTYQEGDTTGKGITLNRISAEEHLIIEVYSSEPGMCFSEHILVVDGEFIINDETDYFEFDSTIEPECLLKYGRLNWTQEQINDYFKTNDTLVICERDFKYTDHTQYLEEIYDKTRNN